MKFSLHFSCLLTAAFALVASAASAQQQTPWGQGLAGYGQTYGNQMVGPVQQVGNAMQQYANGVQQVGGMTYGGGAQAFGAQAYGAPGVTYSGGGGMTYGSTTVGQAFQGGTPVPAQATETMAPMQGAISGTAVSNGPVVTNGAVGVQPMAGAVISQTPEFQSGPPINTQVITGAPIAGGTFVSRPFQGGAWGGPVIAPRPAAGGCPRFFGGVYGLIMDRVDSDEVFFAMDPALPDRLYLSSLDASMNTAGGFETRLGRTFNCCRWGMEVVFWQLFPNDQFASVNVADVPAPTMYLTHDYQDVFLNGAAGPDTIGNLYNNGSLQTLEIRRRFDYHNLELNFLSGPLGPMPNGCCGGCDPCGGGGCGPRVGLGRFGSNCGGGSRWQAGWLFGVRYLSIDEDFLLAADNGDGIVDYSFTGTDEFFHEVNTTNDLVGVQMGMNMNYFLSNRLMLDMGTKFGVYGNHMTMYQRVFNSAGAAYVSPGTPVDLTVDTSDDDIAFLGELRAGLGYRIGCHWRLTGGYRAIAASNVALPLHQLPTGRTLGSFNSFSTINNDASLILHGAYAGAEFAW